MAPLYIINPLQSRAAVGLFSTHPPTHERVKILRSGCAGEVLAAIGEDPLQHDRKSLRLVRKDLDHLLVALVLGHLRQLFLHIDQAVGYVPCLILSGEFDNLPQQTFARRINRWDNASDTFDFLGNGITEAPKINAGDPVAAQTRYTIGARPRLGSPGESRPRPCCRRRAA